MTLRGQPVATKNNGGGGGRGRSKKTEERHGGDRRHTDQGDTLLLQGETVMQWTQLEWSLRVPLASGHLVSAFGLCWLCGIGFKATWSVRGFLFLLQNQVITYTFNMR